jgi:hypothetical protein
VPELCKNSEVMEGGLLLDGGGLKEADDESLNPIVRTCDAIDRRDRVQTSPELSQHADVGLGLGQLILHRLDVRSYVEFLGVR